MIVNLVLLLIVNMRNYLKIHSMTIQLINMSFYFKIFLVAWATLFLNSKNLSFFEKTDNILLIWGDIPFIKKSSIDKLIKFHLSNSNFMSILSNFSYKPYTLIKRDKNSMLKK